MPQEDIEMNVKVDMSWTDALKLRLAGKRWRKRKEMNMNGDIQLFDLKKRRLYLLTVPNMMKEEVEMAQKWINKQRDEGNIPKSTKVLLMSYYRK